MKTKKIFTEEEIIKIIEKELPKIIEKKPEVKIKIQEIVLDKVATKDDIKILAEQIKKIIEQIEKNRKETNERFERLERENAKRFEAIERRFEAMERENAKRFEAIERRFEAMERENAKRFEAIDKRFEMLIKEMREGFKTMKEYIDSKFDRLGSRWGIVSEESYRKGLEEILTPLGFSVIKWKKMDKRAEVFLTPSIVELDILVKNNKRIAVEIKSSLTKGEVDKFERSVRFYEKEEKQKIDKKIIITFFTYPGAKEYARKLGIKLAESEREIKKFI
jgi:hypothetical protein